MDSVQSLAQPVFHLGSSLVLLKCHVHSRAHSPVLCPTVLSRTFHSGPLLTFPPSASAALGSLVLCQMIIGKESVLTCVC